MIRTFTIRNFRTFDTLCFKDLQRVNLIAGDNNTGKTALLEALWQFSGPDKPELGPRLNGFRGIDYLDRDELLFDLFHDFDTSNSVELKADGDWGPHSRILAIDAVPREAVRLTLGDQAAGGDSGLPVPGAESRHEIVLRYTDAESDSVASGWFANRAIAPGLTQPNFEVNRPHLLSSISCHLFTARQRTAPQEVAEQFGRLQLRGLDETIVEAMREFEPRLKRFVTVSINNLPTLHADVGLGRPIPIGLLGDGIQRVLTIAIALCNSTGGMLLLDEVENGIHHSKLSLLWEAIAQFASDFDVQVFATTHSSECVSAAHQTFVDLPGYEFGYFRLDRVHDSIVVKSLDEVMLDTAIEHHLEVR